ncbi:hypothetical protein V8B97DRAFT_308524 [Scleroderma yunnanense]
MIIYPSSDRYIEARCCVLPGSTSLCPPSQNVPGAQYRGRHHRFHRCHTSKFQLVIGITAYAACLSTLLVVLFAFSTKESQRRLVFHLNVLAIIIALILAIFNGITSGKAILKPFNPVSKDVYVATIVFAIFPPLFYDSILLCRLFALYPPAMTPALTLVKIFAFPFCIKCARLVVISLGLNELVSSGPSTAALSQDTLTSWYHNPYMIAEWTMQIADNLYSVSFFLYKLHIRTSTIKRETSIAERIRQIFYISIANFIFPLFFNIAQIVCITTDSSPYTGTMLLMTNDYITVVGVLCATIWFSGTDWVRTRNGSERGVVHVHKWGSGRGQSSDERHGSAIRLASEKSVTLREDSDSAIQSKQLSSLLSYSQNKGHSLV